VISRDHPNPLFLKQLLENSMTMNEHFKKITINTGHIISNNSIAPGHFTLAIELPEYFSQPLPGQFVMLRNIQNGENLLSRPFSVYGFQKVGRQTIMELLCRVAGRGTLLLSHLDAGAAIEVLGPLGQGFATAAGVKKIILVAGGVGAAPLSFLFRGLSIKSSPPQVSVFLGAKTAEIAVAMQSRFVGSTVTKVATDDGSYGYHGVVTDILGEELQKCDYQNTQMFACGPTAMTRSLVRIIDDKPIRCQVSLEERMACGIGACLGCAVATKDASGELFYKRVCKDGPVFDIRELLWNPSV
jgi:dihydroorotate dehydrogenase electron transfer subunit